VLRNSLVTGRVIALNLAVHFLLAWRSGAQIAPRVIRAIRVAMIDFPWWPLASDYQPNHPMRLVLALSPVTINGQNDSAMRTVCPNAAGNRAGKYDAPPGVRRMAMMQESSYRIIAEPRAEKFKVSHAF
jgi:hypothetical protein